LDDIREQVLKMSEFLNPEAIARGLRIPVQTVEDILRGDAEINVTEPVGNYQLPRIEVHSSRTAFRQKVIAVWRGKGGVGCTAIAMHLAYLLKDTMNVLLLDLNLARGGSDLAYYMEIPAYPHLGLVNKNGVQKALINYDKNFYILAPPQQPEELKSVEDISDLIVTCRQDFDAIVIDLPNEETEMVREAVKCSTTLVMVLSAFRREVFRAVERVRPFANKDVIVVANNCKMDTNLLKKLFNTKKVVSIPYDPDIDIVLEDRIFARAKSPFLKGIGELQKLIFQEERKNFLGRLVGK
jgi:Flp pilus assembly CpaE family ATPase